MELAEFLVEPDHIARKDLPWEPATLIPVGDVQWQGEACDKERFRHFIEEGMEQDNPVFLGMGDYIDFVSPSNRAALQSLIATGKLYDSAKESIDLMVEEQIADLMEVLAPTKGRWLGLLEGHHWHRFEDGSTSDMLLARELETKFLGTSAYVQLRWAKPADNKGRKVKSPTGSNTRTSVYKMPSVTIWAHHGRGGGKLPGNPLNSLYHISTGFEADIYLIGHHHRVVATKLPVIKPFFGTKNMSLIHKDRIMACTGGFLKGWMAGSKRGKKAEGSYVEKGMMTPVPLGGLMIRCEPKLLEHSRTLGPPTEVRMDLML